MRDLNGVLYKVVCLKKDNNLMRKTNSLFILSF